MKQLFSYSVIFITLMSILSGGHGLRAATIPRDLQAKLDANNRELQKITEQVQETQKNLGVITAQSKTLSEAIKRIQANINQLALKVRTSELTIAKLELEIEALQYGIEDTEKNISSQKELLMNLFQEAQKNDQESGLILLLRTNTFADFIIEREGNLRISNMLTEKTRELINLQNNLEKNLASTTQKRNEQERERVNLRNLQAIALDEKKSQEELLNQTKNQEALYAQTLAILQARQLEIAQEIEKIEEDLRKTINPNALPGARTGVLQKPVEGRLTQGYGATSFAQYGYAGKWHNGIDIGAPTGTPIYAAETGTVVALGDQDAYCRRGAYGKYIVIKHTNNLTTLYAHLSRQVVSNGSVVKRGELIGYVGSTGYAIGPHLHFTVYDSSTFTMGPSRVCGPMPTGGDINPLNYL